ncbi:MAG: cadherin repeat domain-containing protein, partial [Methanosarcinales archaeon]
MLSSYACWSLSYTVLSITPLAAKCQTPTNLFTYSKTDNRLRIGATPLRAYNCTRGYTVVLRAYRTSYPTNFTDCRIELAVQQTNEPPSFLPGACAPRSVPERADIGTVVGGVVAATDPNVGQHLVWSIDAGAVIYPFDIGPCTGIITVNDGAINYTRNAVFTLPVRVMDVGLTPSMSALCSITINVIDVNDPPTILTTELSAFENSDVGEEVGQIVVFDPDTAGANLTYNWTLVDSSDAFAISRSGMVTVKRDILDFEVKPTYTYRVGVFDGDNFEEGVVVITLMDANDPPTVHPGSFSVPEMSPAGTLVSGGSITVTDQDGDAVTFEVPVVDTFTISGGRFYVAAGVVLDYETTPSYSVDVIANDANEASTVASITIRVIDVNEVPEFDEATGVAMSIEEDTLPGDALGAPISASDPDANTILTYEIVTVTPAGNNHQFSIDGLTGQLRAKSTSYFDYELGVRTYTLAVKVTDNGSPRLSATTTVTVTVTNVNEAPAFSAASYTWSVREDTVVGTVMGSVFATDPEGTAVTYELTTPSSLVTMSASGAFSVATDL